jgi:hypothetical protein
MAEVAEVRAWARANGHDVGVKGRVPDDVQAAYDAAHPPALDEDAGVTEADFPPAPDGDDDATTPAPPPPRRPARERRPRPVKPTRATGWKQLFGTGGKAKAKGPRTDLSEFAEDTWRDLALLTSGIMPPVSRVLTVQAPYAGEVFDTAVKGIPLVDAVLQPVARYSVSLRALNGLLGPAVFTAGICVSGEWVMREDGGGPVIGPDGRPVPAPRTAMMIGGLKYSLLQMSRTADLSRVQERAEADAERMRQVDRLVDFILGYPPVPVPGQESPAPSPQEAPPPAAAPGQVLVPSFTYPPPPQMDDIGAGPS